MSELRYDIVTDETVIINEKRSTRPSDIAEFEEKSDCSYSASKCPFCPGNEEATPPELMSTGEPWKIRVVGNKYPILNMQPSVEKDSNDVIPSIYSKKPLKGKHYVIIDSNRHDGYLHNMDETEIYELLGAYKKLMIKLYEEKEIKHVQIFKNYKKEAGASLEHTHSQAISLDFIPSKNLNVLNNTKSYYEENNECVFCKIIKDELSLGKRVVFENKYFVLLTKYAAVKPYQMVIYPKEHNCSFENISELELKDLAEVLEFVSKKMHKNLNDAPYNLYINSSNVNNQGYIDSFHWNIEITPRLSLDAGFEYSTGVMVNTVSPERAKEILEG